MKQTEICRKKKIKRKLSLLFNYTSILNILGYIRIYFFQKIWCNLSYASRFRACAYLVILWKNSLYQQNFSEILLRSSYSLSPPGQLLPSAQKMKFSIKDFFCKYDHIHSFLWIWSHLLMKSLMETSVFVQCRLDLNRILPYFVSLFLFYNPWLHQEHIYVSGVIERDYWPEIKLIEYNWKHEPFRNKIPYFKIIKLPGCPDCQTKTS